MKKAEGEKKERDECIAVLKEKLKQAEERAQRMESLYNQMCDRVMKKDLEVRSCFSLRFTRLSINQTEIKRIVDNSFFINQTEVKHVVDTVAVFLDFFLYSSKNLFHENQLLQDWCFIHPIDVCIQFINSHYP
jgi:hypothetical protein